MSQAIANAVRQAIADKDHERLWQLIQPKISGSTTTSEQYVRAYRQWLLYCAANNQNPLHPDYGTDQEFINDLIVSGLTPRTAAVRASAMRTLFKVLDELGIVSRPFANANSGEFDTSPRQGYSFAEAQRMLNEAEWPEKAIIHWHIDHGRRLRELMSLRWKNITEHHAVFDGKNKIQLSSGFDEAIHYSPKKRGRIMPYATTRRAAQRFRALADAAQVNYRGIDVLRQLYS